MKAIVARCGFRCDQCPAYTSRTEKARIAGAAGWSRYFKLKVKPASMRCKGCLAGVCKGNEFPSAQCSIRLCVLDRKLDNCAGCREYPCSKLEARMKSVEKRIRQLKGRVPEKEFERFLAPYDARTTLNRLRRGPVT